MTTPNTQRRLLIIDGMCVIRRTYEGVPIADPKAKADGAMRACAASILKAIHHHEPTHFVMAMDTPGKNWRHTLYPAYKAHREPAPQELMDAVPQLVNQLKSYGLRSVYAPGYEGDDVVNTVALKSLAAGFEVIVDSTDKDFLRLLARGAKIWDHFNKAWRNESYCVGKYGIPSARMTDFLALAGDEDDGIPGVTKVGAKTAASLLAEHGSLEGVLDAAHEIKGKVGERLREEADIARLSFKLASMSADTPLSLNAADLRVPATLPSPAEAFNGLLLSRPTAPAGVVRPVSRAEPTLQRLAKSAVADEDEPHPDTVILITALDDRPGAMRGSLVVSHGVHLGTGKTVILSCDSLETYRAQGATYSECIGEYVLDGAKLHAAVRLQEMRDRARGAQGAQAAPSNAAPTVAPAPTQSSGARALMRRLTSSTTKSGHAPASAPPAHTGSASPSTAPATPTRTAVASKPRAPSH